MAERDARVTYRSRVLERDEPRPRVPTALDPYDDPYYIAEPPRRKYNAADSTSTIDDGSTTEVARSATGSAYLSRADDRAQDGYASRRRSTRTDIRGSMDDVRTEKLIVGERRRDDPRRSDPALDRSGIRDGGYRGDGIERSREYYVDDRPRPSGAPYVLDTRHGDVIDITTASKSRDYDTGRGPREYRYDNSRSGRGGAFDRDYDSSLSTRDIDRARGGNIIVLDKGYPSSPSRYQYDEVRSPRSATRGHERDRDDDWRLVDSMRDTRISSKRPHDFEGPPRRRGETFSSEDSYVMVAPSQTSTPRHRERSVSRSAIARRDYPDPELRRRRSRSISFRGSQVDYHDSSERRHERPGVEAQVCGQYLGRKVAELDDDIRSTADRYASHQEPDRRDRVESARFAATYRERGEPYASQIGFKPEPDREPRRRDRSRRRRGDDEVGDDRSYYSENITKTTRETRYR